MPRKRRPLLVGGGILEVDALGFELRERGGRREAYWVASKAARKFGYVPRTVRLHGDLNNRAEVNRMAERCAVLWQEMQQWLAAGGRDSRPIYDGTLGSLIKCYQTDKESPYRNIGQNTRRIYDQWCRLLNRRSGARRIDRLSGQDLRRWFMKLPSRQIPAGFPAFRSPASAFAPCFPFF